MRRRKNHHQDLPRSGPAREALRERGQFWTPDWVADAMVAYVIGDGADHVFDPAVGAGAFFAAARRLASGHRDHITLMGAELDTAVLEQARQTGLSETDLARVEIRNFLTNPPDGPFKAVVANPPYVRHHRLPKPLKEELKELGRSLTGEPLDGRAGVHVYFLLQALRLLSPEGRLAFIVPADICEGVFAMALWNWITRNYRLEAVVTFSPDASPFPGVDTNPIIVAIRNSSPSRTFCWARVTQVDGISLRDWMQSRFPAKVDGGIIAERRRLAEALSTGLSRRQLRNRENQSSLGQFAAVMRGVATGANEFFFLTRRRAEQLGIPAAFLIPSIGRTRDVPGDTIDAPLLRLLDLKGRPTLLFAPDGRAIEEFPKTVREYLNRGRRMGLSRKPLISTRRPWYKMETRRTPPILFAYLGRRNARFIRNPAGVVPLTGFLCVYPRGNDPELVDKLWQVLRHPRTTDNLELVGKTYGEGAIKVEPRALERLPLPADVLADFDLE